MKRVVLALLLLLSFGVKAQIKNTVSLFTRPLVFDKWYDKEVEATANLYAGYNRIVHSRKKRSNILLGLYTGLSLGERKQTRSNPKGTFTLDTKQSYTLGINARYTFYVSKNYTFGTYFSVLGEVIWPNRAEIYKNNSGDTLAFYPNEIVPAPLLPYETRVDNYSYRYFNFLMELGANYYFYKNIGASLAVLYNYHNTNFVASAGLNYRF